MYRKVAEAKFLAKAGVIITDGIRKRETQEASRQVLLFVCVCVCVCVYICVCVDMSLEACQHRCRFAPDYYFSRH